jgi:hypothetical protein
MTPRAKTNSAPLSVSSVPCRWPVERGGREAACGRREVSGGRCGRHRDARGILERVLDPLGPYVAEIFRIRRKILKKAPGSADK